MKSPKQNYQAVIVGAGVAAAGYDDPASQEITTPAHAFVTHPQTTLAGFFDIDSNKAKEAARKWQATAFTDMSDMFIKIMPDIVCVCTPDHTHAKILKEILKFKPKLVIAEKPLTTKLSDTAEVLRLYHSATIPILVNYRRRFDPIVQSVRARIYNGDYGEVLGAVAIYGKGLLHGGSHMIDLGRFLFGEVISTQAVAKREDYLPEDETISGFLVFEHCPVFYLLGADERAYSLFELDIICRKARIRFINEGLAVEIQEVISDSAEPLQWGYKVLGQPLRQPTGLTRSAFGLIDNAVAYLSTGAEIIVSGEDAAKTQSVCADLASQAKQI